MKPVFLKVARSPEHSIDIRHEIAPYFRNPWHFHPELELTLIIQSRGTHFIGDRIRVFYPNELTLTGPNLPHFWRNDPVYYQADAGLQAEAIIIRFSEHFLGKGFFLLPEMHRIRQLMNLARRGLKITGATKEQMARVMRAMPAMDGADKIIGLLQILNTLATSTEYEVLSSIGFVESSGKMDAERINNIYSYVLEGFLRPIHLEEVAGVAHMNPAAFCRYFKNKTGKTFIRFLNEVRIGHACRLLIDGHFNATQACYESGFQNQSYFIKQFKLVTGQTPLQYKRQHEGVHF